MIGVVLVSVILDKFILKKHELVCASLFTFLKKYFLHNLIKSSSEFSLV